MNSIGDAALEFERAIALALNLRGDFLWDSFDGAYFLGRGDR
ncbi:MULTISPECIES: hypothetical protein [unclassified Microcoleus]